MRASHPSPICTAARLSGVPIRIRIAAGVSSPLARRDRRGVLILRSAGLIQFRSAAVGAASLIASVILGGIARLGARVQRVFAEVKVGFGRVFHVSEDRIGASHELGILTQEYGNA